MWGRKCIESHVCGSCNNFAVTAEKRPCVVDGFSAQYLCVCVYIYMCVYICIYIYKINMDLPLRARKCS
jgi:hypothetical protein